MTKDLTFHINNKAYTISGDEELEKELCKYLDTDKNNITYKQINNFRNHTTGFNLNTKVAKKIGFLVDIPTLKVNL